MSRGVLAVLLWAVLPAAFGVNVTTIVDPKEVKLGEALVVTYTVDAQIDEPDFSAIESSFEIVNRRRSQNISMVGGKVSHETVWELVLMPNAAGMLTLPSIDFGDGRSEPNTIKVIEKHEWVATTDVFVEFAADDPNPYVGQPVTLTTQVYAALEISEVEITPPRIIQGDAVIEKLGELRRFSSVRGGKRYSVLEQRYTLHPQATGVVELAAIELKGKAYAKTLNVSSDALSLKVLDTDAVKPALDESVDQESIIVEIEVDKSSVYIQQQVLYAVRLLHSVVVERASLSAPEWSGGDLVVEHLGEDRRYQTIRNNIRYAVIERRYALFPQNSGSFEIKPVEFQGAVPVQTQANLNFWDRPLSRPVRVRSEAFQLDVRERPANATSPWLPSTSLVLDEQWSGSDSIKTGEPLSRTITIEADGLIGSQLPEPVQTAPEGFRQYPERAAHHSKVGQLGAKGTVTQTVALVPTRAGEFVIPEYTLEWWNVDTDQKEIATLPSRKVTVAAEEQQSALVEAVDAGGNGQQVVERVEVPDARAWWLSAALLVLWIATLVLWWLRSRQGSTATARRRQRERRVESERRTLKRLRSACSTRDAEAVKNALLDWGALVAEGSPPRNLGELALLLDDAAARELNLLQQALYGNSEADWSAENLYRSILSRHRANSPDSGDKSVLAPLYAGGQ